MQSQCLTIPISNHLPMLFLHNIWVFLSDKGEGLSRWMCVVLQVLSCDIWPYVDLLTHAALNVTYHHNRPPTHRGLRSHPYSSQVSPT